MPNGRRGNKMQDSEIQQIEATIEELQAKVDLADALDRLHKNRDFKKILLTGFFTDRAVELAKSASQASISETSAKIHSNALIAISGVQGYFNAIYQEGAGAAQSIEEHNALISGVRADG